MFVKTWLSRKCKKRCSVSTPSGGSHSEDCYLWYFLCYISLLVDVLMSSMNAASLLGGNHRDNGARRYGKSVSPLPTFHSSHRLSLIRPSESSSHELLSSDTMMEKTCSPPDPPKSASLPPKTSRMPNSTAPSTITS